MFALVDASRARGAGHKNLSSGARKKFLCPIFPTLNLAGSAAIQHHRGYLKTDQKSKVKKNMQATGQHDNI
jgi:hypothetical protein